MGTEVLRPQDCLIHQRIRVAPAVFHRRKSYTGNANPTTTSRPNHTATSNNHNNQNRKPVSRQDQRRKSPEPSAPSISKRSSSSDDLRSRSHNKNNNNQSNQILMGQVTILRRGESIDSKVNQNHQSSAPLKKNGDNLMVCGTGRLGPDPEMAPKQIRISPSGTGLRSDMYAGSAFSVSPSPSSLPLPSFFSKKQGSRLVDDSATRDLRRLLRLD